MGLWFIYVCLLWSFWQLPGYFAGSVGGPDGGSQLSISHHPTVLGGSQDADGSGYRAHPSAVAHYGGEYSSGFGSAALSSTSLVRDFCLKLI